MTQNARRRGSSIRALSIVLQEAGGLAAPVASLVSSAGSATLAGLLLAATLAAFQPLPPAHAQTPPSPPPSAPVWSDPDDAFTRDGYVQLRWSVPETDTDEYDDVHWVFQLQEGRRPVFDDTDRHYEGRHLSSFLSGLEDGDYYFRVRARHPEGTEWSTWSTTKRVEVQHHSRDLALGLMAVGGLVFLLTAGFLVAHRNDPIPEQANATEPGVEPDDERSAK